MWRYSQGAKLNRSTLTISRPAQNDGKRRKVSELLQGLTVGLPEDLLTFGDLRHAFGERAFGLLLLVFALPNCIPVLNSGFSLVTGLPVVFFALQLAIGQDEPYLPKWLRDRTFTRGHLAHFVVKAGPYLRWLESLIKPRLSAMVYGLGERLLGIVTLVLAVALTLPIPFGNLLPAIALAMLSLALIERDGLLVLVGYAVSVIAGAWILLLYLGAEELVTTIFHLG
jgi:hypothetical protein